MSLLKVGVFKTSRKKQEKRVPIHPDHLEEIDSRIKKNLLFETGYGESFGVDDSQLRSNSAGVVARDVLFEKSDLVLLAKPTKADFEEMVPGTIHWGWPHCVQQKEITQVAIDKKLTLIAWEAMHDWNAEGKWQKHIFNKNNEIAGYAGVHHALSLMGIDGHYGPQRKAIIISFGSVSQGAVLGLQSRGIKDISVLIPENQMVSTDNENLKFARFKQDIAGNLHSLWPGSNSKLLIEELANADIIVNGILQDTDAPLMFVSHDNVSHLKPGCVIIDISCDEGMGFEFAKPTTFAQPMFSIGQIHYYGVDHTPSYLYNVASWEISKGLLPFLPLIMAGPEVWQKNETLLRAVEIKAGVIQNPKIASFQNRSMEYPHQVLKAEMEK